MQAMSYDMIIKVCDAGSTTVLFIAMECKINTVLALAREKKDAKQTNLLFKESHFQYHL